MPLSRPTTLTALTLTALALAARPAAAAAAPLVVAAPVYTITLGGVFSSVDAATFAGVSVGDAFTDTFTLPLGSPALLFSGPGRAIYRSSSFLDGDTITFDGQTIRPAQLTGHYAQLDTAISAPTGQYTYPDLPPTADSLAGSSDGTGAGQPYVQVSWALSTGQYPAAHALTQNLALPLSGPGLTDITAWQNTSFVIQSVSLTSAGVLSPRVPAQLAGKITSIRVSPLGAAAVPEPSPLALLALGLLPLGLVARRRTICKDA